MTHVIPTARKTYDLEVCVDCLFLLANGEQREEGDGGAPVGHAERMKAQWDGMEITLGSLECDYCPTDDNGDCEPWFSWQRCDGCGSTLGGDRHHATAWEAGGE